MTWWRGSLQASPDTIACEMGALDRGKHLERLTVDLSGFGPRGV